MIGYSKRREIYCGHDQELFERLCVLFEQNDVEYDTRQTYGHNTLTFGFARGNPKKQPGKTNYSSLYYVYVTREQLPLAEYLVRNMPSH